MSDPTKNLPWRVVRGDAWYFPGNCSVPAWHVRDSTGAPLFSFHVGGEGDYTEQYAEALARLVAAGSVAGELYAALKGTICPQCAGRGTEDDRHFCPRCDGECRLYSREAKRAALALAAPLLEPKETP